MLRGIFNRIAALPFRHNRVVLIGIVLLTALSLVRVVGLKFVWDQSTIYPKDVPAVEDLNTYGKIFGSSDFLAVTVETTDDDIILKHRKFIGKLIDALDASPLIAKVHTILPEGQSAKINDFMLRHLFLYLNPHDRNRFGWILSPTGLNTVLRKSTLQRLGELLPPLIYRHPLYMLFETLSPLDKLRDPLGVHYLTAKYFSPPDLKFTKLPGDRFFFSRDGEMAFFLLKPAKPFWDFSANEPLVTEVNNIIERVKAVHEREVASRQELGEPVHSAADVKVSFAGFHKAWLENIEMQKRDVRLTIAITAMGVFVVFLLGFRSVRFLPYAWLPLIIAVTWTLGLAGQLYGSINIYTFVFTIMIMGLGIDFAIHLLSGYRAALIKGESSEGAWRTSLSTCGGAVFFGMLTTVVVFSLLLLSDFPAIRQMGVLVAAGLVCAVINIVFFMPALIRLGGSGYHPGSAMPKPREVKPWVESIVRFSMKHAKRVLLITVVFTVVIGVYVYPLRLNPESTEEMLENVPSAEVFKQLVGKIGFNPMYILALSEGRTFPEALTTSYELYGDLKRLQEQGYVVQFDTPSRFLPPYELQRSGLKTLANTPTLNSKTFLKNFRAALRKKQIRSRHFSGDYARMVAKVLAAHDIVTPEKLDALGFADRMKRYIHHEGDRYELATYIYSNPRAFDDEAERRALAKLNALPVVKEGKVKLVSGILARRELRIKMLENLMVILVWAAAAVLVILYICFRSVKQTFMALIPTLVAVVAMLAVFKLLGYQLNAFNSIWLAIILGIGIDDGIHLILRYRSSPGDPAVALGEVGRAITMTTLTTLVAFGSMIFAEFYGVRSSGILVASGMTFALIASLIILPALMKLVIKKP